MTTPLGQVADAYDAWVKSTYDGYDEMYYYYNGEVARRHGAGSRQAKSFLVLTTTLYGLYMASQMVAQGFVDLLRVGETLSNPSVGSAVQDGLRLVSLAAPVFKSARVAGTFGVASGNYASSCGGTATAAAARLSGTKIAMRLRDVEKALNLQPHVLKWKHFNGLYLGEIAMALESIGAKTIHRMIKSFSDVKAMLDLNKGPVIFTMEWFEVAEMRTVRHTMTAFRVLGETSIADQGGVYSASAISHFLGKPQIKFISAWVVEDTALVRAVDRVSGAATAIQLVRGTPEGEAEDLEWLFEDLLIPAWIIPGKVLWGLGELINEKLGRPPLGGQESLSADATKVLRVTPSGAGKSSLMVQVGSGLSTDAFEAAVAELESKGRVRVVRAPGAPLGIVSIVRIK